MFEYLYLWLTTFNVVKSGHCAAFPDDDMLVSDNLRHPSPAFSLPSELSCPVVRRPAATDGAVFLFPTGERGLVTNPHRSSLRPFFATASGQPTHVNVYACAAPSSCAGRNPPQRNAAAPNRGREGVRQTTDGASPGPD